MNPPRRRFVLPGMTTYATESRADTRRPLAAPLLSGVTPEPTALDRDVRVKFASLPVSLRVAARDQSESAILIEGDLPWLAIGTSLGLELPNGIQKSGRVQSFDIDVTPGGSARLRILADLSPPGSRSPEPAPSDDPEPAPQAPRSRIVPLLFLLGASVGGYAGWDPSALRSLVRSAVTVVDGLLQRGL
jgi:hypothetical protein